MQTRTSPQACPILVAAEVTRLNYRHGEEVTASLRRLLIFEMVAALCFILPLPATAATPSAVSPKVFDVRELGAKGDGTTLDTAAIQQAFDDCAKTGGGTVRLTAGTYLSRPLSLGTKTTLLLEKGAVLKATDDPADYLPPGVNWENAKSSQFKPFLNGKGLTDVTITGQGTIDGSGERWWGPAEEARKKTPGFTLPRPNLIRFQACKNVKVIGVTIQNSPKFHLVPDDCEDVLIEGVTILAPDHAANTDAIDPSASRRVTISKCLIDVGDDNVAIKAGKLMPGREFACEDLTITDCTFRHGHGMSIGSETVGGVRNVTVKNCTFDGTENGIRIKSPRGRGGRVENLIVDNITMTNVDSAITITAYYPKVPKEDTAQPVNAETPIFRNIRISNLTATCPKEAGIIIGLPESLVENVVLENVRITAATGLTVRNVKGVQFKNVQVTVKKGLPVIVQEAEVSGLEKAMEKK